MKTPWEISDDDSNISEFDGSNVTSYLHKFNSLADDCGLTNKDKLHRFPVYCKGDLMWEVESLPGYRCRDQAKDGGDWDTFEKSLKKRYYKLDPEQYEYHLSFLYALVRSAATKNAATQSASDTDLRSYSVRFQRIVKVLLNQRKITQYEACEAYLMGLPDKVQEHIWDKLDIQWEDSSKLDVNRIIQQVIDGKDCHLEIKQILGFRESCAPTSSTPTSSTTTSNGRVSAALPSALTPPAPAPAMSARDQELMARILELNSAIEVVNRTIQSPPTPSAATNVVQADLPKVPRNARYW